MGKWKTFTNIGWGIISIALAGFFFLCTYFSFFRANYSNASLDMYNPLILLIGTICYITFLLAVRKWLNQRSQKQLKIISTVLLVFFFFTCCFIGLSTQIIPKVDLRHAYIEAINMLETGTMTDKWQFERFPHQKAVAFMLYFVYRIAGIFGYTNYRVLGIVFNAAMMTIALFFLYRLVYEYRKKETAILTELIFVCNPVLYFYVSYFYSDTLCLPFMMSGLWLAGKGLREATTKKKVMRIIAAAGILTLGAEVRATVIFALFAIFLVVISKEHRRSAVLLCFALIVGLFIGRTIYGQINSTYAGELSDDMGHPITHYLMMGSNEKTIGAWTYADDELTSNLPTHQDKVEGNLTEIANRLKRMGIGGTLRLIKNKIAVVWGDGRMGYHTYNAQMENYNYVYEYSMGDKAIFLRHIMQFVRCSLYLLMFCAVGAFIYKKNAPFSDLVSMVVCLAGFAFYILWEAQPKYSLMYLPVMAVLAGAGIDALYSLRGIQNISILKQGAETQSETYILTKPVLRKVMCGIMCFIMLLSACLWGINYGKYAGNVQKRSEMRVNQTVAYDEQNVNPEGILQSFVPVKTFNCVGIMLSNKEANKNEYIFQLLDKNKNVLVEQKFLSDGAWNKQYRQFQFETIYPDENDMFYIKLYSSMEYDVPLQVSSAYWKQSERYASGYDFYPAGEQIRTDGKDPTDITFRVTYIKERPIVSPRVYLFLSLGSLLLTGVSTFVLYKAPKNKKMDQGE